MPLTQLSELTAISPVDGRYGSKTQALREYQTRLRRFGGV